MRMAKFSKITGRLLNYIDNGQYASAAVGLQDPEIVLTLHEIVFKPDESITVDELKGLENILKVSKSLYELNQYMSGILYRLMPDDMYDRLIEIYKNLNDGKEPFQSFIPAGMRSTEQDFPELAGTLDKAYTVYNVSDKPSVEKWLRKIMKETSRKKLGIIIAPKFDGTSVTITFRNNENILTPVKAVTRGNFEENKGVDLSNILIGRNPIRWIDTVLLPKTVGIQYEAIVTEYGRKRLSEIVNINYSTRRAAIASALKRISNPKTPKDELIEINKCVTLVPLLTDDRIIDLYGKLDKNRDATFEDIFIRMRNSCVFLDSSEKFPYEYTYLYGNIDELLSEIEKTVQEYSSERSQIPYSIDGLVISIVNHTLKNELGRSSNKNKWQIAYKFDAMMQRTKITGILPSMGKQGFIGANITFEPIEFNGVRYEKAPVNNITRFKELNPHIGDEVIVSYNADVMGYIYKDDTCKPAKNGEPLMLPTHCIKCNFELIVTKDMLKCINEDCPGHKVGRILEAIRILNLDFFGEETANDLVEMVGISNAIEFIKMEYKDLSKVLKGLNLEKAWNEFQNKIKAPIEYPKVIDLLRIPGLRTKTAEKILDKISIKELEQLMSSKDEDVLYKKLKTVKGIDKKAKDFSKGLINAYEEFVELKNLLNCVDTKKDYDKVILVSGFRNNPEFEKICKALNFKIIETGSKYDLLVVTPDRLDGKKALIARKKGVPVMLLSEFISQYS